jgi:hypothetical protein
MANPRPAAPPRIGSDARAILTELGYASRDIERLQERGIVGPIEWFRRAPSDPPSELA